MESENMENKKWKINGKMENKSKIGRQIEKCKRHRKIRDKTNRK